MHESSKRLMIARKNASIFLCVQAFDGSLRKILRMK